MAERDEPYDPTAGLTPEEWISGVQEFLVGLAAAQEQSQGTSIREDVGRGVVANTLGLVVPPLRERAVAGMSPVGQVAGEVLNPMNLPLGGAEAALPFLARTRKPPGPRGSFFEKGGRDIGNISNLLGHPRGSPPVVMDVDPKTLKLVDYPPPQGLAGTPLFAAEAPRNVVEQYMLGVTPTGSTLRVSPSGDVDLAELVDWAKSNVRSAKIADPLMKPRTQEDWARLTSVLAQMRLPYNTTNRLGESLMQTPGFVQESARNLGYNALFEDLGQRSIIPRGAMGVAGSKITRAPIPEEQAHLLVRGGMTPEATTKTLIHETGHGIHAQFDPNMADLQFLFGNLSESDFNAVNQELRTNIRRLNPQVPEGHMTEGTGSYNWLDDPTERLTEGILHVITNQRSAEDTMPLFTKLIKDFSAHKLAKDSAGNPRRIPLEFASAIAGILVAQEALSSDDEDEGAQ